MVVLRSAAARRREAGELSAEARHPGIQDGARRDADEQAPRRLRPDKQLWTLATFVGRIQDLPPSVLDAIQPERR